MITLKTMLVKYKFHAYHLILVNLHPLKTMLVKYKSVSISSSPPRGVYFKNNAC